MSQFRHLPVQRVPLSWVEMRLSLAFDEQKNRFGEIKRIDIRTFRIMSSVQELFQYRLIRLFWQIKQTEITSQLRDK